MSIKNISYFGLFLSLLLFFPIHVFSGLSSGTQIATFDGDICIENLIIGSKISGYNPPDASLTDAAVENIRVKEAQGLYIITTDKGVIQASGDQLFYEIISQSFIQAEKLKAGDLLLTKNIEALPCINIEYRNTLAQVYDLILQDPHLFFSSEAQVLTHNHPVLIFTIPWAAPAAVAALVFVGAVALDAYVEKLKNSSNRRDRMDSRNLKEGHQYHEIPPGGGQQPEPNDPKKKKDEEIWKSGVIKKNANTDAHPSTPVGKKGFELKPPFEKAPATNVGTNIKGRNYYDHAIDRMQERGLTPEVVENTIRTGQVRPNKIPGRIGYYDPINNVSVILEIADGTVVTTKFGQ